MKKTLSFILVAAMLLCMIPAFSLFAAEDALATIDTPDELVALAETANAAGRDYKAGQTIKVTANLDMTGKTYTPIKQGLFILDFDGHTLSNLNVTVNDAPGDVGLLAHRLENGGGNGLITNLKIKDCSLTVKGTGSVRAGIVGYADRANVTNVEVDGLTITSNTVGYVGTLMGGKAWGFDSDIKATIKNVTIDAPYAFVGAIVGMTEGDDSFKVTELDSSVTVKNSFNDVTDTTYLGSGDKLVYSEGLKSTVTDQMDGKRTDYSTIDSPAEFAELTKLANMGIAFSGTIKISKDLDMKDITDFQPLNRLTFNLDFDGHTVSNLVVTTKGFDGYAGLIACKTNNATIVDNAKLYNCQLNTSGVANVGVVIGLGDRAIVPNAKVEKVTVNAEGAYLVGGVIGDRQWALDLGDRDGDETEMSAELKDVVINANGATDIGMVAGRMGGDAKIKLTGLKVENVSVANNKEDFDASKVSWLGKADTAENATVADGVKVDVTLSDNVVGYEKPQVSNDTPANNNNNTGNTPPDTGSTPPDNSNKVPPTGDSLVVAVVIVMAALAGAVIVISKKRTVA